MLKLKGGMLLRNDEDKMAHYHHRSTQHGNSHAMRQGKETGTNRKRTQNYYLENLLLEKLKRAKETTIRTNKVAACKECKLYTKYIFNML